MKKRVISVLLCLVLVVALAVSAYAQSEVQPRWNYISRMAAGLQQNNIFGSVTLYENYRVTVTVTLQHWSSGWSDTSRVWSSTGNAYAAAENTRLGLGSGLWRAKVVAKVYNSGGVIIETATVYSDDCLVN